MNKIEIQRLNSVIKVLQNHNVSFKLLDSSELKVFDKTWSKNFMLKSAKLSAHENRWAYLDKENNSVSSEEKSREEYSAQFPSDYVIFTEEGTLGLLCNGKNANLPVWDTIDFDLYVSHNNCKWTYILTHEMPFIGPFFIKKDR